MIDGSVQPDETSPRPVRTKRCGPSRRTFRRLGVVLILTGTLSPTFSRAEAESGRPSQGDVAKHDAAESTTPAAQDLADDSGEDSDDEQRRENLAQVLLMLLAGVGLMGIALITATMIWGARLRRTARLPESGPTQQDELWYLKSPPPTNDGPEQSGQGPADQSDDPVDHRSDSPAIDGETAP